MKLVICKIVYKWTTLRTWIGLKIVQKYLIILTRKALTSYKGTNQKFNLHTTNVILTSRLTLVLKYPPFHRVLNILCTSNSSLYH